MPRSRLRLRHPRAESQPDPLCPGCERTSVPSSATAACRAGRGRSTGPRALGRERQAGRTATFPSGHFAAARLGPVTPQGAAEAWSPTWLSAGSRRRADHSVAHCGRARAQMCHGPARVRARRPVRGPREGRAAGEGLHTWRAVAAPGSSPETPARAVVHRRTHAASAQTTPQPGAGGDASGMGVPTPPGPGRLDRSPWGAPSQEPAPHTTRFIPSSVPSCRLHFPKISPFLLPVSPPRLQRPLLPAEAGPSGSGSRAPEAPAFGLTDGVLGPTGRQSPPSAASGCGRPGHPAAWALNPAARRRQRRFTPNPETHVSHR